MIKLGVSTYRELPIYENQKNPDTACQKHGVFGHPKMHIQKSIFAAFGVWFVCEFLDSQKEMCGNKIAAFVLWISFCD